MRLKIDNGSQATLINPKTIVGLNLEIKQLKFPVSMKAANQMELTLKKYVDTMLIIEGIELQVLMFLHDNTPVGSVLLGTNFQDKYKLSLVHNPESVDKEGFIYYGGKLRRIPVVSVKPSDNIDVEPAEIVEISNNDKLKIILNEVVNKPPKAEGDYFIRKLGDIESVFYLEGGSPGRLKPEVHPLVKINLGTHEPWRLKTFYWGT